MQAHGGAAGQEGHLANALVEDVEAVVEGFEDLVVGQKLDLGAVPGCPLASDDVGHGPAAFVLLGPAIAVAPDLDAHALGDGVDNRDAHAVEATRDFVGSVVEFAAGVERGHHDFERGALDLGVFVDRDAGAVIGDTNPAVAGDDGLDRGCALGQRFVHAVVHDFENQLVQPAAVSAADVHAGTAADGFEALEHLDVFGRIRHAR